MMEDEEEADRDRGVGPQECSGDVEQEEAQTRNADVPP
jgi:hypothetical protein